MSDSSLSYHPGRDHDELRLYDVSAAIGRHRLLFGTAALVGISLTCAAALLRTPHYKATAKLLVEPNVSYVPVTPDENDASVASSHADSRGTEAEINATVSLLTNTSLIRQVLEANRDSVPSGTNRTLLSELKGRLRAALSLPERIYREVHDIPEAARIDQEIARVSAKLRVRPVDKANLVEISYEHYNPHWAARLVNGLLDAYLSPDATLEEPDTRLEFFQGQRSLFEKKLRAAKEEVRAFQAGPAASVAFDGADEVRALRAELELDKAKTEAELAGVIAQLESLETERAGLASSVPVDPMIAKIQPIDELATSVSSLEMERSRLLTRYQPHSVTLRAIEHDIDKAKELLAAHTRTAARALTRSGPASQQLSLLLIESRVEKDRLTAKLGMLTSELDRCTVKFESLDRLAAERGRLEAQLHAAETAYATYLTKEERARFARDLRRAGIRNQVVAEAAAIPAFPESSGVLRILLLGLMLTLTGATGLVLIVDRLDDKLTSIDEVQSIAGTPVVGLVAYDDEFDDELADDASARRGRLLALFAGRPALSLLALGTLAAAGTFLTTVIIRGLPQGSESEAAVLAASATVSAGRVEEPTVSRRPADTRTSARRHEPKRAALRKIDGLVIVNDTADQALRGAPRGLEDLSAATLATALPADTSLAAAPAETAPAALALEPRTQSDDHDHVVLVRRGMTLYSLIRETYGRYTPQRLAMVQGANPGLADPAHIVAGTTLYLPETHVQDISESRGEQ